MLRGLSLLARSTTEAPLFRQRLCGPTFLRYFSEGASGASDDGGDGEDNGSPKRGGGGRGTGRKESSRKRREEGRGKRPADDEEAGEKPKGDVLTSGEGVDRPGEGVGPDGGLPRHSSALVTQAIPETYPQLLALPVAKRPIFPHGVHQLHLTDAKVIEAIKLLSKTGQGYLGTFLTKDDANEADTITDLSQIYRVGSFSSILRIDGYENGASVIINSHRRIRAESLIKTDPYAMVQVHNVKDEPYSKDNVVIQAFTQEIIATVRDIARISGFFRENFAHAQYSQSLVTRSLLEDPALLADFVTNLTSASSSDKQEVLESLVIEERLRKALILLKKELLSAKIQSEISKDVEKKMSARQREYFLQEQLKSIKKELGIEKEDKETLVSKFRELASKKMMPEAVKKVFDEELNKLSHLEGSSSEFNVTRNYLDWLSQLPWGITSQENLDILHASKVLDEDHYGLKDVKERILEFIAVGKLRGTVHGKILCLVGPPGVGKTSIGKSIARTLDRKFFRFSVGGLSDVAEIKGHRRTYVGAMPGKMIQCLKKTQTENPLVLIDEIDKIGRGHNGDPSSALLEMLDPEQNASFLDHYLDVSVDLSKVLFVCTANTLDTIPGPLLDRMEVIRLSGYIEEEKVEISKKYLIPLTLQSTGLNESQIQLSVEAIRSLIHLYCRESGVRNLQKHIDKIYRKAAFRLVKDPSLKSVEITKDNLPDFVGNPIFTSDRTYAINPIGVVCGLAWTSLGGSMLYVESAVDMGAPSGKSSFFRTGQLGEVMNESAAIAYTFAKAFVKSQDPGNDFFEKHSVHLHVPDGATKKDGPSAGVTMASSLISLALKTPPSNDVAMTGELTLTGKVLRIGGVKEKVIAAKRSGIKTILLPISNQADWKELEDHIKEGLQVHFVDYYKDIFPILFPDFQPSPPAPSPLTPPPPQPLPASSPGPAMGTPGPRDQPLAQ